MRRTKKVGQWIAGFSSLQLTKKASQSGVSISPSALIYLARVTDVISLGDYYSDRRYKQKIPPHIGTGDGIGCAGDNIYAPDPAELDGYRQISQIHHDSYDKDHDIRGVNALICEEFYYLGREGRDIPDQIAINIPRRQSPYGIKTDDPESEQALLEWVKDNFGPGQFGLPCLWDERETSCSGC